MLSATTLISLSGTRVALLIKTDSTAMVLPALVPPCMTLLRAFMARIFLTAVV
jgi:hypothetical protein